MDELAEIIGSLRGRSDLLSLIIAGAGGVFSAGADLGEVVRPGLDEVRVFEPERQDVIQHRRVERDVSAGLHLKMHVGTSRELRAARIGDDQRGALLVRAFQRCAEYRVRFGRVCACDEDHVARLFDFAHRARGGSGIDRPLHRGHRR